ncbi:MAG: helix-turn-helix domain-containing protein [Chloroflexi bacterium]|nr:helix-turn-helix domain-containing protein [Chloroflexota bacterium]
MSDLLTTRQLQEMLQVDRTTIYRMVGSGQLPAVRVGNQWRFPREAVERWLQGHTVAGTPPSAEATIPSPQPSEDAHSLFPLECVQQIQDAFADALGVMIVVTDLEGRLITRPSNPCGLYTAADQVPSAHSRCIELWVRMAHNPTLQPRFIPSHLGLLCARGLVRVGAELKAMVIIGGIAPDRWPPSEEEIERIAQDLGVPVEVLQEHIHEVHRLSEEEQARVLPFAQRIADIMSHIAMERYALLDRLQRIAELTVL